MRVEIDGKAINPDSMLFKKVGSKAALKFSKKFVGEEVLVIVLNDVSTRVGKQNAKDLTDEDWLNLRDWTEPSRTDPNWGKNG
ncbi:MAG: hypothetical protein NTW67_06645 [Candidatus Woesearchaeota archaeon]|nr:hypothetical protein [Candidatus Woesearchaeota archaeon]